MRDNRGITLVTLIAYIILGMIVISMLTVLSIHFRDNLNDMTEFTSKDVEYDKLNLQLLKETKTKNNYIDTLLSTSSKVVFTKGNTYTYVSADKTIYLNNNIKVAEDISSCTFLVSEENNKGKLTATIEIEGNTRTTEYIFALEEDISKNHLATLCTLNTVSDCSYCGGTGLHSHEWTEITGGYEEVCSACGASAVGFYEVCAPCGASSIVYYCSCGETWRYYNSGQENGPCTDCSNYCSTHEMSGSHYVCDSHSYVGTDDTCPGI